MYPERIVEKLCDNSLAFDRHFYYDYSLPDIAFEDFSSFIAWTDILYNAATKKPAILSPLGNILGRAISGKDGIFPHEFVRIALERYSNDKLTESVAVGWLNSRGARSVTDGLREKKRETQYREYARALELEYPQTAKVLLIIANDYQWEAKRDRQYSESFPR